jgi:hypothetical protein
MSGFQKQVYVQPAPAVAGDFASANPRATVLAGPGSLVAGSGGVTVGRFAWAASSGSTDINTGETDFYNTVTNAGSGVPTGFVHREQQALITTFLAEASMVVPQGLPVVLHNAGDFWATNAGASAVTAGMKVFASTTTGQIAAAAAGATVTGYVETKWYAMSAAAAGELFKISSYALG